MFKEFFPFILVGNVNKENPVKLRYVKAITHPSTFPGFSVGIYLLWPKTRGKRAVDSIQVFKDLKTTNGNFMLFVQDFILNKYLLLK